MLLIIGIYVLVGMIAGFVAGLLGIGGGVIIVPLLKWAFSLTGVPIALQMHLAMGTSLAAMSVTAALSLRAHLKSGAEIWPIYRQLMWGIGVGTVIGALLADVLTSRWLSILFGAFLLGMSVRMFWPARADQEPNLPRPWVMRLVSLIVGSKSGLLGIGGGTLIIPFLTHFNVPIRTAVSVTVACSLTIAIIGAVSFMITGLQAVSLPVYSVGYIYWPAVMGIVAASPFFAHLGAKLGCKLPAETLRRVFAFVLLGISLHMLLK